MGRQMAALLDEPRTRHRRPTCTNQRQYEHWHRGALVSTGRVTPTAWSWNTLVLGHAVSYSLLSWTEMFGTCLAARRVVGKKQRDTPQRVRMAAWHDAALERCFVSGALCG